MQSRTRTFASPLVAALLIAAIPAFAGDDGARGAGDCLTRPRDNTPAGAHWRYRVDHANHRNCWYLKDDSGRKDASDPGESETADAAASPARDAPSGAMPRDGAPQAEEAIPPASANARAELRPDPPRAARPRPSSAAAAKPDPAAQPVASQPAPGAGLEGVRDPSVIRVSDAAPGDTAARAPAPVDAALNDAELAPTVGQTTALAARNDDVNEPMRVFLGLLLIGAGVCVLAGCAAFHFLYGGVRLPMDATGGEVTDGVG
jgi:hypothetical protein